MATRKWGTEFLVNSTLTGNQDQSSVTALADGGFVIAWRDDGPTDSVIRYQRFDAAGARAGSEITDTGNLYAPYHDPQSPAITQLSDGNLLIVSDSIDSAGNIIGNVETLSGTYVRHETGVEDWPMDVATPAVASLGANGNVMVWRADVPAGSSTIYFRGFDAAGAVLYDPLPIAYSNEAPDIAANRTGTRFAVAWTNDQSNSGDINVRVYGSGGNDLTSILTVNTDTAYVQGEAKLAWIDASRFVVSWTTVESSAAFGDGLGTAVHFAIFNEFGYAMGAERLANSTVLGDQKGSAVTGLSNGGFAIAWEDHSGSGADTSGSAIRMQVFDGVGNRVGTEILVNTTTAGDQSDLALATLADGRVVVTWTDTSSGSADIRSQIVDPRDGIVTGTAAADRLYGNDAVGDEISGYDGADLLFGLKGNDVLYGGAGNDTVNSGGGDDTAYGGADNDDLRGNSGDDTLFGEDGNDTLRGGLGADELDGGAGKDTASYISASSAVVISLDGSLTAKGEAAGDTLIRIENLTGSDVSGAGDTLKGDGAANVLSGLGGADKLIGGNGNDTLIGGLQSDRLTGGTGDDAFVYNALNEGGDTITDFSSFASGNNDAFNFKGSVFGGLAPGAITDTQFQSSISDLAGTADVRFFFETDTGILRFDADGSGAGAATVIATLQAGAVVAAADIVII